jgi:hypothetical protein
MTIAELTALLIAIGSMPVLLKIIDWFKATRSGRAQAEKINNRNALGRLVKAEEESEFQTEWRRIISEHASTVRRIALDWGVPEHVLPDWPKPPERIRV